MLLSKHSLPLLVVLVVVVVLSPSSVDAAVAAKTVDETIATTTTTATDVDAVVEEEEQNRHRSLDIKFDDEVDYFEFFSDKEDWDECVEEGTIESYTESCPPTISIEEAACRAELIVWGLADIENMATGEVKIRVNWYSKAFDNPRKSIVKWGGGLDNSEEGNTFFYNDSGEFHVWVKGFDDDKHCGTGFPLPNTEMYFFLKAVDGNPDVVTIDDYTKELNVKFELVTTILDSGIANDNLAGSEVYDYIRRYSVADSSYGPLDRDCDAIRCCYRQGCSECEGTNYDDCKWKYKPYKPEGDSAVNNNNGRMMMMMITTVVIIMFGLF